MPFNVADLVGRGFLPRELPPAFSSVTLGHACASIMPGLGSLVSDSIKDAHNNVRPAAFNLARQGTLRRRLSIPHPLHYINICSPIQTHSQFIEDVINKSTISASQPIVDSTGSGRAIDRRLKDDALTDEHTRIRATAQYVVHADIANCYGSIYTHAIGWGARWPLTYEGIRAAWLPQIGRVPAITQVPGFQSLSQAGVSFFDTTKTIDITPKDKSVPGGPYGGS